MAPAAQSGADARQGVADALQWPSTVAQAASVLVPPPELPEEKRASIESLFEEFDGDQNGSLDAGELQVRTALPACRTAQPCS